MKRFRISIRVALLLVALVAIPFAIDQALESKIRILNSALRNDPESIIGTQAELNGLKANRENLKFTNLTSLTDRLSFRRRLSVEFDELRNVESAFGVSGMVLDKRQKKVLITPISTSVD